MSEYITHLSLSVWITSLRIIFSFFFGFLELRDRVPPRKLLAEELLGSGPPEAQTAPRVCLLSAVELNIGSLGLDPNWTGFIPCLYLFYFHPNLSSES